MKKIILFASGNGTNVENIIQYFKSKTNISIVGIFSNNPNAKVLVKANKYAIPTVVFNKEELSNGFVLNVINKTNPDLIILAGFLLKFPEQIIDCYQQKVINIHPALLPKYGGKGMYGMHVHQSVFENNEVETGITIHYVNINYDEGSIIFQEKVNIATCNSPDAIAEKVQELEYSFYPKIIEKLLTFTT